MAFLWLSLCVCLIYITAATTTGLQGCASAVCHPPEILRDVAIIIE